MNDAAYQLLIGDVTAELRRLDEASVHCVVTSPPYWGLRDYGTGTWEGGDPECEHCVDRFAYQASEKQRSNKASGSKQARHACPKCGARRIDKQLGLEPTPDEYLARMVEVFREVRRVLRKDGTLWLNVGDSYVGGGGYSPSSPSNLAGSIQSKLGGSKPGGIRPQNGLNSKNLVGIPWRLAFALQSDGWYLRSDVIWHKPNPMPESVTDRPTKSHEYVFLMAPSARYYYDADSVRESLSSPIHAPMNKVGADEGGHLRNDFGTDAMTRQWGNPAGRNLRDVWTIPTQPCPEAHFATFPEKLVEPCIKAGTSAKGCCPKCGAGWERIVESVRVATRPGRNNVADPTGMAFRDPLRHVTTKVITGWQPRCDCYGRWCTYRWTGEDGEVETRRYWRSGKHPPLREPVVLDPFAGRGTAGIVALRLGRRFVGIELNPKYAALAETNLQAAATGLTALEVRSGQGALFGVKGGDA